MRSSRTICLALAALNAFVLAARFFPGDSDRLEARVSLSARDVKPPMTRGAPVPFRPEGERPEPAADSASAPEPGPAGPSEATSDSKAFVYLGTMTSSGGRIEYFFKDIESDRVYSAALGHGDIKVLEASEKEFLIEIDGTKYRVAR